MKLETTAHPKKPRGWVWLFAFIALGLLAIATWLVKGKTHRLLSGIGFLLIAPLMFLHPVRFTKPLLPQIKAPPRLGRTENWLAIAGMIAIFSGFVMQTLW